MTAVAAARRGSCCARDSTCSFARACAIFAPQPIERAGVSDLPENNTESMPPPPTKNQQEAIAEVVMSTAWQQLEAAALTLARSGPIKDRLADAYRKHLSLVSAEELPEALRAEFRACHDALTREPPLRGEEAVRATVRKLSSHEADELACTVVRLFAAMV